MICKRYVSPRCLISKLLTNLGNLLYYIHSLSSSQTRVLSRNFHKGSFLCAYTCTFLKVEKLAIFHPQQYLRYFLILYCDKHVLLIVTYNCSLIFFVSISSIGFFPPLLLLFPSLFSPSQ